jgi:hypothetical protein
MSSISINDLACNTSLDSRAMSAVRGGSGFGPPDVTVNVAVNQKFAHLQQISVDVLNGNGVIGAGFGGIDVAKAAAEWSNRAD